jgi:hypothetical protein
MIESINDVKPDTMAKLKLLYKVSKKIGFVPRMEQLLEQIIEMTQKALDAEATSILLFHGNDQELYFETTSGPVKNELSYVKINFPRPYGRGISLCQTSFALCLFYLGAQCTLV